MIEINVVREKYASMTDSELISFAKNEVHQLTEEGYRLLKDELIRRKLESGNIDDKATEKISIAKENAQKDDQLIASSLLYAFDQKENGKNNEEIIKGLIESGMEEPEANELVFNIEVIAKKRLKEADQERLIGSFILIGGVAITFLPLSMPANRLTYIIAWCAILFGILQLIKAMYNKSRFKRIIENIAAENNH